MGGACGGAVLGLMLACLVDPALAQISPFRPPPGQGSPAPPPGTVRESPGPTSPSALYITQQPGNTLLATEYVGQPVYGRDRQKVGTISNLLVDPTGQVVGVVLSVGGFLGLGAREVAIGFEALFPTREADRDIFLLDLSEAQLASAPRFRRAK